MLHGVSFIGCHNLGYILVKGIARDLQQIFGILHLVFGSINSFRNRPYRVLFIVQISLFDQAFQNFVTIVLI
ncbi:hypothetical protein SDC9_157386 [bioreactor metagenome]|uniref:Uncharacterized protein n=1 Tax=bioreactor metagenome TaxID=1076179 RepID=A0A645FCK8_9ZZZZ